MTPRPFPWLPQTAADALAPRPKARYVADGILRLPSVSVVYGAPGCLKTMLMTDLAACVAAGKPWLSPKPGDPGQGIATAQGAAALIDFDNGEEVTLERVGAALRGHGLDASAPVLAVSMPSPWLDLTDSGSPHDPNRCSHGEQLGEWLAAFYVRLAVIDNLASICGDADENSGEMALVMGGLRRAATRAGCAIVVIHHARKSSVVRGRAGDALRGHSSIEAAIDLALAVERQDDTVTLTATKTRHGDIAPFGALFTFEHAPTSRDLERVRFFGVKAGAIAPGQMARDAILDALAGGSWNWSNLFQIAKKAEPSLGRTRFATILDSMVARGEVVESAGPLKNTRLFSLGLMTP